MSTSYARSGQKTVTTAGTAVQGDDVPGATFAIKAHPSNTNPVWVGNASNTVSSSNGFPLSAGEAILLEVANLSLLWFDATTSGEKVCWLRVN